MILGAIFVVLSLVVIGLLGIKTVQLHDKMLDLQSNYYNSQVENILTIQKEKNIDRESISKISITNTNRRPGL